MDIFNDFDKWQDALRKIDLQESSMPYVRGKLLTENLDIYAKVLKLLNCKNMECCHPYLYNLDIEELEESEIAKVNNLYKLGVDKGFIEAEDDLHTDECDICGDNSCNDPASHLTTSDAAIKPAIPTQAPSPAPVVLPPMSAFTVMYSAMKDGQIKTGEAYSNSINTRSAKADVISKLERAGYSSISILAIEAGDPDMVGCDNTFCKQPEVAAIPDYSVTEDDMIDGRNHNGHVSEDDVLNNGEHNMHVAEAADKEDAKAEDADREADDKKEEKAEEPEKKVADKEDAKAEDADREADDKKEEKAEEPDEKLKDEPADKEDADDKKDDDKELEPAEKATLKDSYKKAFKAAMLKCKYVDRSFEDLSLEEKVEFFTVLSRAWGTKADPSKFMSDKELDLLEKITVKK